MAATLALGDRAALSHRSAAELWNLIPGCSSPVHVTVPGGGRTRRRGLAIHRSPAAGEVTRKRGIPVTKPPRTLIDLAETASPRQLERATDEAIRQRLTTEAQLRRAIDRHPGRPGAAKLSALLSEHAVGTTATENDFEELLIGICDDFGIRALVARSPSGPTGPTSPGPTQQLDRRSRQLGDSRHPQGLRGRPPQGRGAARDGVDRSPLHPPPNDARARMGRTNAAAASLCPQCQRQKRSHRPSPWRARTAS